ncbi:Na+-dependent transporter, SNF family [Halalkaliarchaeum desulfuricum]|uniref:Transporter n=1 Tax=Halalkaliarchaeum desulfuricum TaxID=2055893 RepID=A0A343TKY3_9EURY|nr:sodium-dependent transporter [Halalkaliarchaeum desulfuricum]AUX09755.1 Na+-dependent transporter, SNF family [Halalkaliarchaeum desulfuricum]
MSDAKVSRAEWGTRFGFLMAMIGAMVGSGNIWRFPFVLGENGGGAFLLAFLILLFLIAVPGLMAETALGRYSEKGVIGALRDCTGPGGMAGLGVIVILVNIALMTYYSPVVGWILYYMLQSFTLEFTAAGFEAEAFWTAFTNSPGIMVLMHTIVMALVAGVLVLGIRDGVERLVVYAVPGLVIALAAIAIRALTLPGAAEGLAFTFTVQWEYLLISDTWIAALGQALFSTGLGWGIAITVGSYLREYDDAPLGGGFFTAIGEASIGVLAAFAIFPLVFAYGLDPDAGAGLTFITLVQVFEPMPIGDLWAIIFFVGFFLAAFTSAVVITEVTVTTVFEESPLSRNQTVLAVTGVIWLLGLPSAYSVSFLDFADFTFANWGLPLATLAVMIGIGWYFTPERLRVLSVNKTSGLYVGTWFNPIVKYLIPVVMVGIMAFFAYENFGTNEMIAGVAVLITFPIAGYLIMNYFDKPEATTDTAAPGGDD